MDSNAIRQAFFDFFQSKGHRIVPSAPMVIKNDPTLMFTNAGMNQFKDIFLGNSPVNHPRIADSQKCLRVSGKHNDLEEVGHDTYHHTMFEMLGNWSFGDYFKKEAIEWAWEFLTRVVKLDPGRMYSTVFEGSPEEDIDFDQEAFDHWRAFLPADRILKGNKKDNFWEMGETGPCGPCSEIHVDLRDEEDRKVIPGRDLVNTGHPLVIEIWNLVFIQYNRKASGELEKLPLQHVDTGMGFERLCMAVEGRKSNYDTGVFRPLLASISDLCGMPYGTDVKKDIAMRVIADHLRAIAFSVADGQLPSNVRAGYVIRRILRRAVRYAFTFLNQSDPFMYRLVPVLRDSMGAAYPELKKQEELITRVIQEEESSFLRTLETGIRRLDQHMDRLKTQGLQVLEGPEAFILFDTYGFPFDLTELILRENGLDVDRAGFQAEMEAQKTRSRSAAAVETDDWVWVNDSEGDEFLGYDHLEAHVHITRWRKVKTKGKEMVQLVFDRTPFYAESGGQVGDSGVLVQGDEQVPILDTIRENNLVIHLAQQVPTNPSLPFLARVDSQKRQETEGNHSATHLLHFALRKVLGEHVEQKGSLVEPDRLRFDFSHFQKMSEEEIGQVESLVNEMIRANYELDENRHARFSEAVAAGAMALFGEKYSEEVRVVKFGPSLELCGGTHVGSTGRIGSFKILSEGAIAAGIRRIEAITGSRAAEFIGEQLTLLRELNMRLRNPKDPLMALDQLIEENAGLKKLIEGFEKEKGKALKDNLKPKVKDVNGVKVLVEMVDLPNSQVIKDIVFQLRDEIPGLFCVLGARLEGKASLTVMIADELVKTKAWNASQFVREIAREVEGGGGGQAFFATAGGKKPEGLEKALELAKSLIEKMAN